MFTVVSPAPRIMPGTKLVLKYVLTELNETMLLCAQHPLSDNCFYLFNSNRYLLGSY